MRLETVFSISILTCLVSDRLVAFDKNGVAPRAISLPSGPGSIQGLGESYQPQLNNGSGSYRVTIALPRGTGGLTPELALSYSSGSGNGSIGLGWSLSGPSSIRRSTDRGVPRYVDGPNGADDDFDGQVDNPEEVDTHTGVNQEELVALADGSFRAENEGEFWRYARLGEGWEARAPDGRRLVFGQSAQARVEEGGRVFEWRLERQLDKNQNAIDYEYLSDPATPAQKYLRRVRWGQGPGAPFFAAICRYQEGRPDASTSFQAGLGLRTSLRLAGIDVFSQGIPAPPFALRADFDGDGKADALIRRYQLDYDAGSHLSLLSRVTQLGADGVTALPPLTLRYSQWTPPDDVAASIIRSDGAPVEGLNSGSLELIEMNGDGLPDLLSTAGSQHRAFLNLGLDAQGRLAWAPGRPVGHAPSIDLASDRTHLADATADGLSDLLVKASNTSFLCFDNTSDVAWTGSPFSIRNTDTWPIWPYDGEGGKLSRSFDSDYSRSNDILHTSLTGNQLWLLLPGGRYSRELRSPPLTFEGQVFRFDLPGTHIADLNGDRLQDLAWIQASRAVYFPSRGRGDFAPPIVLNLGKTLTADEIERADFSDMDGDGLADLTVVRPAFFPNGVVYWLNRFDRGLDGPRTVRGLPPLAAGDALRWADLNGNGTNDIVISQAQSASGEKILVIDLIPEGKIHLLKSIENGLGLRVDLYYESSTAQMVRAAAEGNPWSSRMPLPVTVVSRIVEDDGRGQVFDQTFRYRDPYYDASKQEFRGFRSAEAREAGDASVSGKLTRMVFETGREFPCLKGKVLGQEVLREDGKLFTSSTSSWGMRLLARGLDGREVCFAFEEAVDQLVHEGEPNGIRVRTETDYDDFGNPVAERRYGIFDRTGDEVFIERAFDTRPQTWLLDLVASETMRDGAGNRFAEQRFFHDDRGNVERTESWLDTEDRFVVAVSQRFDGFGNLIESTDARGNRRSIAYDILLHAFPVGESLHLGARDLLMSAEYDLGFGAVTVAVDFYGQRGEYAYDALGRLESRTMPGGAGESYQYQFGSPVSLVLKRVREDAQGATFDSYSYSDGYGRPLGTKVEAEGGRWRFLQAKAYNARKLEFRSWPPFSTDAPEYSLPDPALPHEERSYDAQGRLVETRLADGSVKREEHRPLAVAIYDGNDTAAGGEPDLRRLDGLGRITSVEERNGGETYLTRYGWNARGELETVTDALGNVKRFRFDSLGRLIEVKDPDRGLRRYAYDDVGNRVRSEDAKGQVISQAYDAANRVLEKVHAGAGAGGADAAEAVYHYDEPAGVLDFGDGSSGNARNVLGRLAWVEDRSGEEHYSYDERGNIEWVLKRLRAHGTSVLVPYRTRRSYDLLNREAEIIFPDNDRLRTVRGTGSFIQRIDGGPQGGIILAAADYAPSGQPVRLRLGNGIESVYEYDAAQRLTRLRAMNAAGLEILHESLAYDQVSNVIEILDRRSLVEVPAGSPRRRTAQFAYDDLHRLTQVRYGDGPSGGRIDYVYDALGNLLVQSTPPAGQTGHLDDASVNLGALAYQGGRSGRDGRLASDPPGPHAVTGTASGRRFSYDASGNLDLLDGAALKWDFEDRLEGFTQGKIEAEYLHDHARRRVSKRVLDGRALEETVYPDPAFEIRNGSPVKYALLDGRRLARIHGMLDPTRERVQRLTLAAGWNLIAAAVESPASLRDAFGSDAAFYEARGSDYRPVDSSVAVPAGKALWVHAPAARLVVLRGRYPVAPDGRSPGPLHAWPLLEPFRPAAHLDSSASLMVYDAAGRRWLRRDPSLPSFLSDAPEGLGAAQAFWSPGELTLRPSAAAPQATVFYHQDHLGSTAAVTDAGGGLLEERAHYPFGAVRNVHRPAAAGGGAHHDFTGKERDPESGLMVMGARGYLDLAGVFLSPDPRFADAALLPSGSSADQQSFSAFLANPQMGNLYAYATRNPLKFVDPSGLEIVYSKVLRDSPVFQEALELFKSTQEGKRLLASVEQSGARVTLRAGRGWLWNPVAKKVQEWAALTQPLGPKDYRVTINLIEAKGKFKDKDDLIIDIANSIHHELRHIEGEVNSWRLREVRGVLRTLDKFAQDHQLPSAPIDPILRMGNEVHRALDTYKTPSDDPFSATFQKQAEEARLFQRRD